MGYSVLQTLFNNESFFDYRQNKRNEIKNEIDQISDNDLLCPNRDEMLQWLIENYTLEEIVLDINNIEKSYEHGKIENYDNRYRLCDNVDTLFVSWKIPYTGVEALLFVQPSTYLRQSFKAVIFDQSLTIKDFSSLSELDKDSHVIEKKLQNQLDNLLEQIGYLNNDIRSFNDQLEGFLSGILEEREKKANIVKLALDAMNIPLQRNDNAPSIVPLKRKLVKPSMPTATREKSYHILDEDYRHILGVIRHVGATFERARRTFKKLDEEELRDIILANLNGHYLGEATSETFRNNGKTDINIEFENRAAFVGECKIWKGDKVFGEAIEQLLSYTTWRDAKNAIVFFNKNNKTFVAIQKKIRELLASIDNGSLVETVAGEWEMKLNSDGNEKIVHIFLFDIFEEANLGSED